MSVGSRILVTGGAGFIGANLCHRLQQNSQISEIVVLDDLSSGNAENLAGAAVTFIEGSILDSSLLEKASGGCDAIVHLAAVPSVPRSVADPLRSHEANATGTLNVLEAARKAGGAHVILASSSSVYGANPKLPKTEDLMCQPMSPYAVSKLAAEQYALAYAACYSLPVLPFRFFNVYGPLQPAGHAYAAVIPAFIDAALRGEAIPLHGEGTQSRDFTFVDSVTAVLERAAIDRKCSGPVNLAFGTRTSLLELIARLAELLGRQLAVANNPVRAGDVPHSQAGCDRLRSLFPDVEPVGLEVGLRKTLSWFQKA